MILEFYQVFEYNLIWQVDSIGCYCSVLLFKFLLFILPSLQNIKMQWNFNMKSARKKKRFSIKYCVIKNYDMCKINSSTSISKGEKMNSKINCVFFSCINPLSVYLMKNVQSSSQACVCVCLFSLKWTIYITL